MPLKKVNGEKDRLGIHTQMTMERIERARQRAFASEKPCHTAQSVNEKIAELAKRLADPNDTSARDDTLVFLSYRYSSLPRETILRIKTLIEHHDAQEHALCRTTKEHPDKTFRENIPAAKENIVRLTNHLGELQNIKKGEEPLWYKIYLHTDLGSYAQVR